MSSLGDAVADKVLRQFEALPPKCKPDRDGKGNSNWVPLSGVVVSSEGTLNCVALATGMRCLPASQVPSAQGFVLHDWHAEVLAIRLFNAFLLHECQQLARSNSPTSRYVRRRTQHEISDEQFQPFALQDGLKLHLYCSEAPCGDASMELTMRAQDNASPWQVEASLDPDGSRPLQGRGYFSELGVVRRKPARRDSPETLSKSCSDKLALKQAISLLSSVNALLISPENAYLHNIVLPESQHVQKACMRAFAATGRLNRLANHAWPGGYAFRPFDVETTAREFDFSKRSICNLGMKLQSSNKSAAWTPYIQETLINGVLQGRKQTDVRGASAASRLSIWWTIASTAGGLAIPMLEHVAHARTYAEVKRTKLLADRRQVKKDVLKEGLVGWVPNVEDDFALDSSPSS